MRILRSATIVAMCLPLLLVAFPLVSARQDVTKVLTGVESTAHFEIRFRPGSRAGAEVERIASVVERDLERIATLLAVANDGRYRLHVYDDVPELQAITHKEGVGGYSGGSDLHIPFDSDQTRFHELVHVVSARLPKSGAEPRNLFFAEGLSNALLEFVDGVHVDAVAAFARARNELPRLSEMTGAADFYAWLRGRERIGVYDIAGSFVRSLLDAHGVEKTKLYYTGTSAQAAFGVDEAQLEKAWHERLDARKPRPEVETLLRRRRGEAVPFTTIGGDPEALLPKELLGKPSDWQWLDRAKLDTDTPKEWSKAGKAIKGSHSADANWTFCDLGSTEYGDCVMRATIVPASGCVGVLLRLGPETEAMITNAGTFVYAQSSGVVAVESAEPIGGRKTIDLFVVRRDETLTICIDGRKVLEGKASANKAPVGLGVAGGEATFENVRVRALDR